MSVRTLLVAALLAVLGPAPPSGAVSAAAPAERAPASPAPAGETKGAPSAPADTEPAGALLDDVVRVLAEHYYDERFRTEELPALAARFRPAARAAQNPAEERAVVRALLAHVPASHLALMSRPAFEAMHAELERRPAPSFGLQLERHAGAWFATWVYEGGPADRAGVLAGDEVLAIDGVTPAVSPRLDWPTDDAALPDPPLRALLADSGAVVELHLRRRADAPPFDVRVAAAEDSGWAATLRSARVVERDGLALGVLHLWHVPAGGPSRLVAELADGRFAECAGLVLDLRGRGGHASEVERLLRALERRWRRPIVALAHGETRSAKEVIALEIRERNLGLLVGERTAGAVIPASFAEVGDGALLMFPAFTLGEYTERIEGQGVAPDVWVPDLLPYSAGADPILERGLDVLAKLCTGRLAEIERGARPVR